MLRHHGGERVNAGFYLDVRTWEVTTLSGTGGALPGGADDRYVRMPTAGVLVFAPLMGAAYAIFLPFIGIAMVVQHLSKRAVEGARDGAQSLARTLGPAWRPGEAHFTGEPGKDGTGDDSAEKPLHDRLQRVADEIERRERGE